MRTSGFSATTNSSNGGTTNRTDCYGLRTTLAKARKIMLLCGIINELEKDSGVLSCFFCQASINSATAVRRWRPRRMPEMTAQVTDQSAKPGRWTIQG